MPQQRGTQSVSLAFFAPAFIFIVFITIIWSQKLSGLKLSIFNKVLATISNSFGDIKFHLSREIVLVFGLSMVNHGKKARIGGEQGSCPFWYLSLLPFVKNTPLYFISSSSSPAIPVAFLEEHFGMHTNNTSVMFIPGLSILWQSYLTGLHQVFTFFEFSLLFIRVIK
jgi:hypothetical protein